MKNIGLNIGSHKKRQIIIRLDPCYLTIDSIFRRVCSHYGLDPQYVKSRDSLRFRDEVEIRQITMYLSTHLLNHSFRVIGLFFNGKVIGKDHATVSHSKKKIPHLLMYNKEFREKNKEFIDNMLSLKSIKIRT